MVVAPDNLSAIIKHDIILYNVGSIIIETVGNSIPEGYFFRDNNTISLGDDENTLILKGINRSAKRSYSKKDKIKTIYSHDF